MAKNDYNVIVCIILAYMYKCLKDGKPVDVELMNPKMLGIPDNYWGILLDIWQKATTLKVVLANITRVDILLGLMMTISILRQRELNICKKMTT